MRRFVSSLKFGHSGSASSANPSCSSFNPVDRSHPPSHSATLAPLREIGSCRPSAVARESHLDRLMTIPATARQVALPKRLTERMSARYLQVGDDVARQNLETVRQLQEISTDLGRLPICFYPFGGADGLYPSLLTHAKLTILTGAEQWGRLKDISKALDIDQIDTSIYGMGLGGGFDGVRDWYEAAEGYGFQPGTLGPLSVTRAIVAQVFNGERIDQVAVSAFELGEGGQIHFKKIPSKHAVNDDIAFWLTNSQGQRTLYLYKKLHIDDAQTSGIIDNLHALLAHVSQPKQVLQLQKGIPHSLFDNHATQRLLAPSSDLIKAVVCDQHQNKNHRSQPVFFNEAALSQERIGLRTVSLANRPAFGYGRDVFIHRPV